ncbi:hypothetical protein JKA74_00305 [Marivirga sp. S37H4]|uniref:Tetratricopeptide repeat protein n=1 Tax=Marivirga aurantiaca TaxID=2802615 RepID=A0A935C608_9BACT|nr:hypothetical protein [Marivirga aurantiaca]MBK6263457.1 hypothetical protein [Marivirga aurantiaca]
MKFINIKYLLFGILAISAFGCDLLDPTEVVNPNLTEETVLNTPNPTSPLVNGVRRQAAILTNAHVPISEIASDNYDNTQTFYNQNMDDLVIRPTDADMNTLNQQVARLRELAMYGLQTVVPQDPDATAEQIAELHFWKGYAFMLSSELFSSLPIEPEGEAVSSSVIADSALKEMNIVISQGGSQTDLMASAQLASARIHRAQGNKMEAVDFAQSAINTSPDLILYIEFDQQNGPLNTMQTALVDRGTFDDFQVLPRMDFLDPKYYFRGANQASPVAVLKIEEAHLIIAEALLSDQDLTAGISKLRDVINVVDSRPVESFSNQQQDRTQRSPGSRPDSTDIEVAASPTDSLRSGLVLYRKGDPISVPTVSGTSVDNDYLDNVTTLDGALETLYLIRQEVFIGEGRRIMDMGVKFVIGEIEYLSNPNIDPSDPGVSPVIPSFIDNVRTELDDFTYDPEAREAVILHDLNRILVENKTSPYVLPFE